MVLVGRAVTVRKQQVENCLKFDLCDFERQINFKIHCNGTVKSTDSFGRISIFGFELWPHSILRFYYSVIKADGKNLNFDYKVLICLTSCNFGGRRRWLTCPDCKRRCRVIYIPPNQDTFGCRICNKLTYRSQQEKNTW